MPGIVAIDIDLHRLHAYSSVHGRLAYNAPSLDIDKLAAHDVVLAECWSPYMYMDFIKKTPKSMRGELINRMKACLFNSFMIGALDTQLRARGVELLVAPSSAWTLNHPEKVRHIMAGCEGVDNHDIRECRAMIYFYSHHPRAWKPLAAYASEL